MRESRAKGNGAPVTWMIKPGCIIRIFQCALMLCRYQRPLRQNIVNLEGYNYIQPLKKSFINSVFLLIKSCFLQYSVQHIIY